MKQFNKQKTALVTGSAGFIGFHICQKLLNEGWRVVGIDCISDYYDISLKLRRNGMLNQSPCYFFIQKKIEDSNVLLDLFKDEKPDIVIHLAAQAGVRYSIENPRSYLESNIIGTFELLEAARLHPPKHMLLASTSSAYGVNKDLPYKETDKADHQISFYAATKKSTENIAHSYSHLFKLPITMFRFFTVYGPWGRPDMALFKFTKAILNDEPIDIFNHGEMSRDFTYIDDLTEGMKLLINHVPSLEFNDDVSSNSLDSKSPAAPFRIVNIGNSKPISLLSYIAALEKSLGIKAKKNLMPMQPGDVHATWANIDLLSKLTGYLPKYDIETGVENFVKWYRSYYNS